MRYARLVLLMALFIGLSLHVLAQETDASGTATESAEAATASAAAPSVEEAKPPRIDAFRSVNGLEQWRYEYDISDYEKGKYNLIIEGRDHAGNVYTEGPFNIVVDPESDLPIANISNPTPNMRVGGNLNIVGTCVDDDAVGSVEISINDGPFTVASGEEFWSYELNTDDLLDGSYKITARGTDINGVVGRGTSVIFNIDKRKPVFEITSHVNGDLVNGKIDLVGTVGDLNGIESLSFSTDNGETYQDLSFKGDKSATQVDFSVRISTTEIEDGPAIYWFQGQDRTGSVDQSAFLLFVDNEPPEISILYPTEEHAVNGKFTVSGKVADDVGVERLTWRVGKDEEVEIPLRPGDPYWIQDFDFTGQDEAEIVFNLIDKTGNTTEERLELLLAAEEDLPVVDVYYPADGGQAEENRLAGFVRDDDGVSGVAYSIDGGAEVILDTGQAFDIRLPELQAGSHSLEISAIDINDVRGTPVKASFTKVADPPLIEVVSVVGSDGKVDPFRNGMGISTEIIDAIKGTITYRNPVGAATYSLADGDNLALSLSKTDSVEVMEFTITLPKETIPYGFVELVIDAVDGYERTARRHAAFYVQNLTKNRSEHGVYFDDARITGGKPILLRRGESLTGRYIGYPVDSISLDPPTDVVTVRENGGVIEISADREGVTGVTRLVLTSNRGTVFTAGPYVFSTDTTPPKIEFDLSVKSGRTGGTVRLRGTVTDNIGGISMSYILNEEEITIPVSGTGESAEFNSSVSLGNLPEEGVSVAVKAEDSSGNIAVEYLILNRTPRYVADPEANKDPSPIVQIAYPAPAQVVRQTDMVRGRVFIGGVVSGVGGVTELYYSLDRGEERSFAASDTFELTFPDIAPGTHSIQIRAVSDKQVSAQSARVEFVVATSFPSIEITDTGIASGELRFQPGMDIPVVVDTKVFGTASEGVSSLTYSVDGGEETSVKLTNGESGIKTFALPIGKYTRYGRHNLKLAATDSHGNTFPLETFYYRVEPRSSRAIADNEGIFAADPRFSSNNTVTIDRNESFFFHYHGRTISEVKLSVETDVVAVSGRDDLLTLRATADGSVDDISIIVLTVDGDEHRTLPVSIVVDGDAPNITLADDYTGDWVGDTVPIKGSVTDNLGLLELTVSVGGQVLLSPVLQSPESTEAVVEIPVDVDLSLEALPDGFLTITVMAVDVAANVTIQEFLVRKDSTPPSVAQISPEPTAPVNGQFLFSARSIDEGNIALVEYSNDGVTFQPVNGLVLFSGDMSMNRLAVAVENQVYRITDQAGNQALFVPDLNLDPESDVPIVQIQIPEDGSLIRTDFTVSGMVFDDDAVRSIEYRLDDGEYQPLEAANNFEIMLKLEDLADNRHTIEVKASDLAGVESEPIMMWFNVSKAEPRSILTAPSISETVKGTVTLTGKSLDENGVESVFVSFDNGNTFNRAEGGAEWFYSLDTRTLPDGTYSLLIRAIDSFGVDALYTTLLNIDNTVPTLEMTGFIDREPFADVINVRGRITDSIGINSVHIDILPVEGDEHHREMPVVESAETVVVKDTDDIEVPAEDIESFLSIDVPPDEVLLQTIDLSSLAPGLYNLQITAEDKAKNTGYISRNFEKIASLQISSIDIMFPAQGERLFGEFSLQGHIDTPVPPERAALYIDDELFEALEITPFGYYAVTVTPERLTEGPHVLVVEAKLPDGEIIKTESRTIEYSKTGPWIVIDNFGAGDFASQRPWVEGRAGYTSDDVPEDDAEAKKYLKNLAVTRIDVSIDNGKTFQEAKGTEEWQFRLETQAIQDGQVNLMVRARFRDNSTAVAKTQLLIDDTPPQVTLISPEEGMSFNDSISLSGTAFDANGLADVTVALRKGDKSQYEVPTFIQGLFLDAHFLGSTYWEAGAGLTFFDDNVKLSFFVGNSPPGRFTGLVLGAKLLANIAVLPYGFLFGPDWNFLSSSIAVGANFSYFNMAGDEGTEASGLVLGAVIGQIELARIEIAEWRVFNAFSVYVEGQLWFISSDIEGGSLGKLAFGIRSEVF